MDWAYIPLCRGRRIKRLLCHHKLSKQRDPLLLLFFAVLCLCQKQGLDLFLKFCCLCNEEVISVDTKPGSLQRSYTCLYGNISDNSSGISSSRVSGSLSGGAQLQKRSACFDPWPDNDINHHTLFHRAQTLLWNPLMLFRSTPHRGPLFFLYLVDIFFVSTKVKSMRSRKERKKYKTERIANCLSFVPLVLEIPTITSCILYTQDKAAVPHNKWNLKREEKGGGLRDTHKKRGAHHRRKEKKTEKHFCCIEICTSSSDQMAHLYRKGKGRYNKRIIIEKLIIPSVSVILPFHELSCTSSSSRSLLPFDMRISRSFSASSLRASTSVSDNIAWLGTFTQLSIAPALYGGTLSDSPHRVHVSYFYEFLIRVGK